jgi:DNA-binding NtrC family response regulator
MSERLRVMVVDDDRLNRVTMLQQMLQDGYVVTTVENAFQALEQLETGGWDAVVTDMRMPTMDGLELLRSIKARFPDVDVILITAYGSVETAVTAMQEGAADYLTKPFRFPELVFRLHKLEEARAARQEISTLHAFLDNAPSYYGLVGHSSLMKNVYERIRNFAANVAPVLVEGETGTGKELVARALHLQGGRAKEPFVALSCGSIPRELAESELFGHEKGAFTNAIQRRKGNFERAHRGTLLLDDVDDLPLEMQVKLLRVLQEGTIVRVGGGEEIAVDVRVVATTKQSLDKLVAEGRFRDDLFYRLRGLEIHLPPLRERGDDVLLVARHFLDLLAIRDRSEPKRLSADASEILCRHNWPGNVRELRRALESACVVCHGAEISAQDVPEYLRQVDLGGRASASLFTLHLDRSQSLHFNEQVERFEDALIQWALTKAGGQQLHAAELLNLPRTTFQSKIGRHGKNRIPAQVAAENQA